MTTARKPRPAYLTRDEVEAMIAAAVAAERERSEATMDLVMGAVGSAMKEMRTAAEALAASAIQLDRRETLFSMPTLDPSFLHPASDDAAN